MPFHETPSSSQANSIKEDSIWPTPEEIDGDESKTLHVLLTTAYERQTRIGWAHFLKGRLTIAWKPVKDGCAGHL